MEKVREHDKISPLVFNNETNFQTNSFLNNSGLLDNKISVLLYSMHPVIRHPNSSYLAACPDCSRVP